MRTAAEIAWDKWQPPRVSYTASIRNNATGEIRQKEFTDPAEDCHEGIPSDFAWEEGNYSCDCNRAIFFYEVGESPESEQCSEGKFSVNLSTSGEIFYREF